MEERPFNHTGFRAFLAERRLMAARCANCGELMLPPRPLCPRCYSTQMAWVEMSGEGELAGFTAIYVGLSTLAEEGYGRDRPYCSGLVRLSEGPLVAGYLVDMGCADPAQIQVGEQVTATYIEHALAGEMQISLGFRRKGPAQPPEPDSTKTF